VVSLFIKLHSFHNAAKYDHSDEIHARMVSVKFSFSLSFPISSVASDDHGISYVGPTSGLEVNISAPTLPSG